MNDAELVEVLRCTANDSEDAICKGKKCPLYGYEGCCYDYAGLVAADRIEELLAEVERLRPVNGTPGNVYDRTLIDCMRGFGSVEVDENTRPEYFRKWRSFSELSALRLELLLKKIDQLDREKAALMEQLGKTDINCEYCAQQIEGYAPCDQFESCRECTADCACKDCENNSHWKWQGLKE